MNIGFSEMLIIAAIALVFLGPEKFPEFAKIVIRTVRDVRGYVAEAKRDIAQEFKPIKKEMKELGRYEPEKYLDTLAKSVNDAMSDEPSGGKSQPVAPATEPEPGEPSPEAEEGPTAAPGTQTYGGSNYSAARQGSRYEGPERIDG